MGRRHTEYPLVTERGEFPRLRIRTDDLEMLPWMGERMAGILRELGIKSVAELKGRDPERLYRRALRLGRWRGDRVLLYMFRSAVYYAEYLVCDPEKRLWWYWKEHEYLYGGSAGEQGESARSRLVRRAVPEDRQAVEEFLREFDDEGGECMSGEVAARNASSFWPLFLSAAEEGRACLSEEGKRVAALLLLDMNEKRPLFLAALSEAARWGECDRLLDWMRRRKLERAAAVRDRERPRECPGTRRDARKRTRPANDSGIMREEIRGGKETTQ